MALLYLGLFLFFVPHFLAFTPVKSRAIAALGEKGWKGLFSLVSLIGLVLLAAGYWSSRAGPEAANFLWYPPDWTRHANMLLVLLGLVSIAVSFTRGHLKKWLRNPMSVGVGLWAAGHLLANGKLASVLIFGSFLLLSVTDILVSTARGQLPAHDPKPSQDGIAIVAGVALYAFFLFVFHPYVLNLPVIQ